MCIIEYTHFNEEKVCFLFLQKHHVGTTNYLLYYFTRLRKNSPVKLIKTCVEYNK